MKRTTHVHLIAGLFTKDFSLQNTTHLKMEKNPLLIFFFTDEEITFSQLILFKFTQISMKTTAATKIQVTHPT